MDLINEHNNKYRFFADITGEAMKVYNKFRPGLMESAYEAALKHLLKKGNHKVEQQVWLPMYWDDEKLDQDYRMDLVVDNVILELKAVQYVNSEHRKQLWSYMNLTHTEYGMLLNFGNRQGLLSEWYKRYDDGNIEKIRLF